MEPFCNCSCGCVEPKTNARIRVCTPCAYNWFLAPKAHGTKPSFQKAHKAQQTAHESSETDGKGG